jgi:hypothetical protein
MKAHFDRDSRARCGKAGAQLADDKSGVTCLRCLALLNGTYNAGIRWYDVKPCGTSAAYRRHLRHGERIDESCRQANVRDTADRKARRRRTRKVLVA